MTLAAVMGKVACPAMIAATVRAALRVASTSPDPGRTLAVVDRAVESDLGANDAFATLLHLRLDAQSGDIARVHVDHGLAVV